MNLYIFFISTIFSNVKCKSTLCSEIQNYCLGLRLTYEEVTKEYMVGCIELKAQEIIQLMLKNYHEDQEVLKINEKIKYVIKINDKKHEYRLNENCTFINEIDNLRISFLNIEPNISFYNNDKFYIPSKIYEIYIYLHHFMHQQIVNYDTKELTEYLLELSFIDMAGNMFDKDFNDRLMFDVIMILQDHIILSVCGDIGTIILNDNCFIDSAAMKYLFKHGMSMLIMYTYQKNTNAIISKKNFFEFNYSDRSPIDYADPDFMYLSKDKLIFKSKLDDDIDRSIFDTLKDRRTYNFMTQHALEIVKSICDKEEIRDTNVKLNFIFSFNWKRDFLNLIMYAYSYLELCLYGPDYMLEDYKIFKMTIMEILDYRMLSDAKLLINDKQKNNIKLSNVTPYLLIHSKKNYTESFILNYKIKADHKNFFKMYKDLLNILTDKYQSILIANIGILFGLNNKDDDIIKFLSFSEDCFKMPKNTTKGFNISDAERTSFIGALSLLLDLIDNEIKYKKHYIENKVYQKTNIVLIDQMLTLFIEKNDESKLAQEVRAAKFDSLDQKKKKLKSKLKKSINKIDRKEESEKRQCGDNTDAGNPDDRIQKTGRKTSKTKGVIRKQKECESQKHQPDSIPTKEIVDTISKNHDPISDNINSFNNSFELNKFHKVDNKKVSDKTSIDPHSNNECTHSKQPKDFKIDEDTDLQGISAKGPNDNKTIVIIETSPKKVQKTSRRVHSYGGILTNKFNYDSKASSKKPKNKTKRSKTEETKFDRKDTITPIKEMESLCLEQNTDFEEKMTGTLDPLISVLNTDNVISLEDNEKNITQKLEQRYEESKNFELVATNEEINQLTPQSTLCDAHLVIESAKTNDDCSNPTEKDQKQEPSNIKIDQSRNKTYTTNKQFGGRKNTPNGKTLPWSKPNNECTTSTIHNAETTPLYRLNKNQFKNKYIPKFCNDRFKNQRSNIHQQGLTNIHDYGWQQRKNYFTGLNDYKHLHEQYSDVNNDMSDFCNTCYKNQQTKFNDSIAQNLHPSIHPIYKITNEPLSYTFGNNTYTQDAYYLSPIDEFCCLTFPTKQNYDLLIQYNYIPRETLHV